MRTSVFSSPFFFFFFSSSFSSYDYYYYYSSFSSIFSLSVSSSTPLREVNAPVFEDFPLPLPLPLPPAIYLSSSLIEHPEIPSMFNNGSISQGEILLKDIYETLRKYVVILSKERLERRRWGCGRGNPFPLSNFPLILPSHYAFANRPSLEFSSMERDSAFHIL